MGHQEAACMISQPISGTNHSTTCQAARLQGKSSKGYNPWLAVRPQDLAESGCFGLIGIDCKFAAWACGWLYLKRHSAPNQSASLRPSAALEALIHVITLLSHCPHQAIAAHDILEPAHGSQLCGNVWRVSHNGQRCNQNELSRGMCIVGTIKHIWLAV